MRYGTNLMWERTFPTWENSFPTSENYFPTWNPCDFPRKSASYPKNTGFLTKLTRCSVRTVAGYMAGVAFGLWPKSIEPPAYAHASARQAGSTLQR